MEHLFGPPQPSPPPFHKLPPSPARAWIVSPGSQASAQESKHSFPSGEPAGDLAEVTRTPLWLLRFSESPPVSVSCPSSTCRLALVDPLSRADSNGGSPVAQDGVSGASPKPGRLRHRGRSLEVFGSCEAQIVLFKMKATAEFWVFVWPCFVLFYVSKFQRTRPCGPHSIFCVGFCLKGSRVLVGGTCPTSAHSVTGRRPG